MSVRIYRAMRMDTREIIQTGVPVPEFSAAYLGNRDLSAFYSSAQEAEEAFPNLFDKGITFFAYTDEQKAALLDWGCTSVISLETTAENQRLRLTFAPGYYLDVFLAGQWTVFYYYCPAGWLRLDISRQLPSSLIGPDFCAFSSADGVSTKYYNPASALYRRSSNPADFALYGFQEGSFSGTSHYFYPASPRTFSYFQCSYRNAAGNSVATNGVVSTPNNNWKWIFTRDDILSGTDDMAYFFRSFWSGAVSAHTVQISPSLFGSVTVSSALALPGDTVTLSAVPDSGYRLQALSVSANGEEIETIQTAPGVFDFYMPESDVSAAAVFQKSPILPVASHGAFVKGFLTGQALKAAQDAPAYFLPNPDPHGGSYERDSFLMGLAFGRAAAAKF